MDKNGICQLFNIEDTIRLVAKQQQKFGNGIRKEPDEKKKMDLFIPMNDYTEFELLNLAHIYHVIVIPPDTPTSESAEESDHRFLVTSKSEILKFYTGNISSLSTLKEIFTDATDAVADTDSIDNTINTVSKDAVSSTVTTIPKESADRTINTVSKDAVSGTAAKLSKDRVDRTATTVSKDAVDGTVNTVSKKSVKSRNTKKKSTLMAVPELPRLNEGLNETVPLRLSQRIDFSLLCSEGIPLLREDDQPKRCDPEGRKPDDKCPSNFWCHVGTSMETNYCCPTNRKIPNLCHLPPNSGFGTEKITRFWYDWRAGYCRDMIYTSFGGNQNNFVSRQDCEKKCSGTPRPSNLETVSKVIVEQKKVNPEPLVTTTQSGLRSGTQTPPLSQPPPQPGSGPQGVQIVEKSENPCNLSPDKGKKSSPIQRPSIRWYFDLAAERCVQFNFFGFYSNANNFENEKICLEACGGGPQELSSCLYPMEVGLGEYSIPRYYYNAQTKSCRKFTYRGSGGNFNRFVTRNTCEAVCIKGIYIFNMNKYTVDSDPFAIPDIMSTTTSASIPKTSPVIVQSEAERISEMFEKMAEINEENIEKNDPFSIPTSTIPNLPVFPLTISPDEQGSEEVGNSEFLGTISTFGSMTQPGYLPTTTPGTYPTLISLVEDKNEEPETQTPEVYTFSKSPEAFGFRFGKHIAATTPGNIVDSRPYNSIYANTIKLTPEEAIKTALQNVYELTQSGLVKSNQKNSLPISPCIFSSTSDVYIKSCRPTETHPIPGFWSQICPENSFCQVGENLQQSICCPKFGGSPCLQQRTPGGNENNFLTFESCRQTCSAINICPFGSPYGFENLDGSQKCSPDRPSCPPHYYCQISEASSGAICCPLFNGTTPDSSRNITFHKFAPQGIPLDNLPQEVSPVENIPQEISSGGEFPQGSPLVGAHISHSRKPASPCSMPITPGSGPLTLHRWGYSKSKKSCVNFLYSGSGTSQNNFLTKTDCIKTCESTVNPCGNSLLILNPSQLQKCNSQTDCPSDSYCHFGGSPDSNVCCPASSVNPCLLSMDPGRGSMILHRYYFDTSTSTCKGFTYLGIGGNGNNFRNIQECRQTCPEYENPCPKGKPPTNPVDGNVATCSATNQNCPKNYFCHIGDSRRTTVCCPRLSKDPCTPGVILGMGSAQLPRYYYNSKMRNCEQFFYSGKGGNENNFINKVDCEISCPVLDNPCSSGFPALDPYGEPVLCSTAEPDVCPQGYWCHIGGTQATTLCCPGSKSLACKLPMSRGKGTSVLNRWYFNTESKVCVNFVYSGRSGNQNNFISRQQCLSVCPEYESPCQVGQPHIGLSGQITHCGATDPTICPATYWCHIGATLETSVCCPGAADPCDQSKISGTGEHSLTRYHYNQLTRTCLQFKYSGKAGNENNFITKAACESRCPVFVSPCGAGVPEMDESLAHIPCSAADNSTCSPGHWCHIGADEETTICCSEASLNICEQSLILGTGGASLPRYYFNPLTKQCLPFIYSGRNGNQNNFLSKASCEAACETLQNPCLLGEPATGANGMYVTCSSSSPNVCPSGYWCHVGADVTESICCPGDSDPCSLPFAPGDGEEKLTRYYFDSNLRRCTKFTYAGKYGNVNNFETLSQCQMKCPEFQNPCPSGDPAQAPGGGILFCSSERQTCPTSYWCHIGANLESTVCCPNADSDPCLSGMSVGSGPHKLSRFYFNQHTRQCLQFTYTGYLGSQNSFRSIKECENKCPVFKSPCPGTQENPLVAVTRCSAQNPQSCPSGYWCHIGGTPDSSACCPGASFDPCRLPRSQGVVEKTGPYTRWYFDMKSRSCKPFQYGGTRGNENNFLTKEDCAQRCPEFVNPCFVGEALVDHSTSSVKFCNPQNFMDCPNGYYCHAGTTIENSVCCLRHPGTQMTSGARFNSFPDTVSHNFPDTASHHFPETVSQLPPRTIFKPLRTTPNYGFPKSSGRSPFNSRMAKHGTQTVEFNHNSPDPIHIPSLRQLCPHGDPLMTPFGLPETCDIHGDQPCSNPEFICSLMSTGEAYCCPDTSELF
ncbi:hypothetical protein FO519_007832, partial [Halicephalobus sp. NKZ332]